MNGRKNNMDKFKPGVEGIVLIFSDGDGNVVYEFPFYKVLRQDLEPLLLEVSGTAGSILHTPLWLSQLAGWAPVHVTVESSNPVRWHNLYRHDSRSLCARLAQPDLSV